ATPRRAASGRRFARSGSPSSLMSSARPALLQDHVPGAHRHGAEGDGVEGDERGDEPPREEAADEEPHANGAVAERLASPVPERLAARPFVRRDEGGGEPDQREPG